MKFAVENDDSIAGGDWKRPGVFLVDEGVYRVVLPLPMDGLQAVNVYLLPHGGRVTIVDSGWAIPQARELLVGALGALDFSLADVDRFLITHAHRDHYEQSLAVRQELGTRVLLGIGEKRNLDYAVSDDYVPMGPQLEQLRSLGGHTIADEIAAALPTRPEFVDVPMLPDEWLEPGHISVGADRVLNAVPTPGHTQGHMVFRDEAARLLFAGDHILPSITPSIGFELIPATNPLGDFMGALTLVRNMPDARLLPAHGPITASAHQRIDELLAHHVRRLDECAEGLRSGCTTAFDVAHHLRWTRHERSFPELDVFNQMLATFETGAHLDLLVAQARARLEIHDAIRHYVGL